MYADILHGEGKEDLFHDGWEDQVDDDTVRTTDYFIYSETLDRFGVDCLQ